MCMLQDTAADVSALRLCSRFRSILPMYSTHAYHAPPARVIQIPSAFNGVIVRWKSETAHRIVSACFTFAA